ncbi:MAG: hypothetical protein WBN07_04970 [Woeseiaceae bacterium]|jgi:hypothetical protein
MAAKRFPLPKRFNAALSEKAYARLRALSDKYCYGNNYLLTVLLENFDTISDAAAVDKAFAAFEKEYGAPTTSGMKTK